MNIWRPTYSPPRFETTAHLWYLWFLCAAYKCTYLLTYGTYLLTYLLNYVSMLLIWNIHTSPVNFSACWSVVWYWCWFSKVFSWSLRLHVIICVLRKLQSISLSIRAVERLIFLIALIALLIILIARIYACALIFLTALIFFNRD